MTNFQKWVKVSEKVDENTDFLCTPSMKKTPKILKALALGKPLISEKWVLASKKDLADPTKFILQDKDMESSLELPPAWSAGDSRADLFRGLPILITPALRSSYGSGYKDIVDICKVLKSKVSSFSANKLVAGDDYVVLGLEADDSDAAAASKLGKPVYSKEILPMAIIRGYGTYTHP
jgi:hypothetical protein